MVNQDICLKCRARRGKDRSLYVDAWVCPAKASLELSGYYSERLIIRSTDNVPECCLYLFEQGVSEGMKHED
jgi:hypothetical protein